METLTGFLNAFAVRWAAWMVQMSWQVAILIGIVWLVTIAFRKSSASFRYVLWLVVFVKLVIPPTLAAPWSAGNFIPKFSIVRQPVMNRSFNPQTVEEPNAPANAVPQQISIVPTPPARAAAVKPAGLKPSTLLMLCWTAIALGLFATFAYQYRRYSRRVSRGISLPSVAIQTLFSKRMKALHVPRDVTLMVSAGIQTPAVFGFWRPIILLPEGETLSEEELSNVIVHELAHIKRKDMFISLIAGLLSCVYWFHPAVWLANLYLRREREMACDDVVLRTTDQKARSYASTIVRVAESFQESVPVGAGFLGLVELSDNLLHRLRSVADTHRARRLGWASIPLILLIMIAFVPMGVWSQPSAGQTNPAPRDAHTVLRERCAKNLKQIGLALKMFANDHDGRFPAISGQRGNLIFDSPGFFLKYLPDASVLRCPGSKGYKPVAPPGTAADITDQSYFYLGWVVTTEQEGLALLDAYESIDLRERDKDLPLDPTKSPVGHKKLYRFREGIERFWITDINNPAAAAIPPSSMPVMWERPGNHQPDGGNVLYMDGHVEFVQYREKFPMTEKFMTRLIQISARKGATSQAAESETAPSESGGARAAGGLMPMAVPGVPLGGAGAGTPATTPSASAQTEGYSSAGGQPQQVAPSAPEIVSVSPAIGASDVDPATKKIRVTFDQDMREGFSWTGGGAAFPKGAGAPHWVDKRTCVAPVELEPGKFYRVGINSKSHRNFCGVNGIPARNRVVYFATKGADPETLKALKPPTIVSMNPENGATNVPSTLTQLSVTFDQPMGGGCSWTGGGENFPEGTDAPQWNADMKTCTMPVKLKPHWNYRLGLNSESAINFQSAHGVPLEPVVWQFSTGD